MLWPVLLALAASALAQPPRSAARGYVPRRPSPCEQSSCYPATGNLLIGRQDKLTASSTCGVGSQERYCIISNREERKCFWCDTRQETVNDPARNHRVSNIIYRYHPGTRLPSWWQSRNGVENATLRLDLEAEFHFTHVIIVFKTFRPAAMLMERSSDFGKTWRVYRYFAHNCALSFPGVPEEIPRTLTDVVCESRYSGVAPSTGGEVIFRVLPPHIEVANPYSVEVQNLLKMTNLRINFTRLHTLGDDLLDNRPEIQEKYYYAISSMTVRGSCSCHGHASRCLPQQGKVSRPDMLHGRCECTHNTKGLNCDLCEDSHNDLAWQPALGKMTNACKKCTCYDHTEECHFDPAVYEMTGKVSGGVCDNCRHNTWGRNCELCKPFYYRDPDQELNSPDVCRACDCDPRGSLEEAICDAATDVVNGLEAGRCHCKANVEGRRCDTCKNGHWNFDEANPDGCEECACNGLGTVDNGGCDVYTGECTCKRYVSGRHCNQCLPEYYGLSADDQGCKPCDCNIGGALDNNCDIITGQCTCRTNVEGRRCDTSSQNFFSGALDALVYEAEISNCNGGPDENAIGSNCQVVIREPFRDGREDTWTGTGFMKVFENDHLVFPIDDISTSMEYDILIRYEPQHPGDWAEVSVTVERPGPVGLDSPCANSKPGQDLKSAYLPDNSRGVIVEPPVCLEAGKHYNIRIDFERQTPGVSNARAAVLIDSIVLVPRVLSLPFFNGAEPAAEARRRDYERARCGDSYYYNIHKGDLPDVCQQYHISVGMYVFNGSVACTCDPTGSTSHKCENYGGRCPCKTNVVGRRCNSCAPGTYGFGPDGCKACDCNNIGALDKFCEKDGGQCKCQPNTYGRQCDECQPGFWNFPNCKQCDCHGHADVCDSRTGACTSCRDSTEGHHCDRCREGYYGDPRLGVDIPCRACPCPDTEVSGHSFASRCVLDDQSNNVVCDCHTGYAGSRCDVCGDNYFGHPEIGGGSCEACDCNNNVDVMKPGNCDPHTGRCLECLYDTAGEHCEVCREGYYGDALEKDCTECVCEILGTNATQGPCDGVTGQCPCYRNVMGLECNGCFPDHWKIASGEGCDPCDCDLVGSSANQCNEFDGQCECKSGFGGRRCDQCQAGYWGDPNVECYRCSCDPTGSFSQQCQRDTGACICLPGIGGYKCDECARGFLGAAPTCEPCRECFDNWDRIIGGLLIQTEHAIANASNMKTVGATGAYTKDFEDMENKLNEFQQLSDTYAVDVEKLKHVNKTVDELKVEYAKTNKNVTDLSNVLGDVATKIGLAEADLKTLRESAKKLKVKADELKNNATQLQEANLEGALNLTRDAKQRAIDAADSADSVQLIIRDSDRQIKGTEHILTKQYETFNNTQNMNTKELKGLQDALDELESHIPELNDEMCGHATDKCDRCGGAGCGVCGGLSCERGAVTKADKALELANKTDTTLKEYDLEASNLLRELAAVKTETTAARDTAQNTNELAAVARNYTDDIIKESSDLTRDLTDFLTNQTATPADIRTLAQQILDMKIELKPEQITTLSNQINETVSQLTNIESIIQETSEDLREAKELNETAGYTKKDALETLDDVTSVVEAIKEAQKAQALAEKAINKANEDIEAAKRDITPIGSETDEAQRRANETVGQVKHLEDRLKGLEKQLLTMGNDAQQVKNEASQNLKEADEAYNQARELRNKFQEANTTLVERVDQTASSRERVQLLLKKATQLASDTHKQLQQLQSMESLYNSHAKALNKHEDLIDDLNRQMDFYLAEIKKKSDGYISCAT